MIYAKLKPTGRGAVFAAVVLTMLCMCQIVSAAGIDPAAK